MWTNLLLILIEATIIGLALFLSWFSFTAPVCLICYIVGAKFIWQIPTAVWLVTFSIKNWDNAKTWFK